MVMTAALVMRTMRVPIVVATFGTLLTILSGVFLRAEGIYVNIALVVSSSVIAACGLL
jgi:hypothetical protein